MGGNGVEGERRNSEESGEEGRHFLRKEEINNDDNNRSAEFSLISFVIFLFFYWLFL